VTEPIHGDWLVVRWSSGRALEVEGVSPL